jgi:hypothetical protein
MNEKNAIATIYQLIEQTNASGLFKKLEHLDAARSAFETLRRSVDELEKLRKQTSKNSHTDESRTVAGGGG